jgi:hypothetical protein
VRELFLLEGEARAQVASEQRSLLDEGQQLAINGLFGQPCGRRAIPSSVDWIRRSIICSPHKKMDNNLIYLFLFVQKVGFRLLGLSFLGLSEISVVDVLRDFNGSDIKLGGGGNNVSLVNATKRNTVDLEGTFK